MFKQILIILVVIALALTVTGCCCCGTGYGYDDYYYYSEVGDTTAPGGACGQCDGNAACGSNGCQSSCGN